MLLWRDHGEGNGSPLQYSCLENPMDGRAWWAAVHGVAKSRTRPSDFTFTFHFHALEQEMAIHSSVLAWRIPGTGGAWRAAVYGVAQSRTRLKRLSSSSSTESQSNKDGCTWSLEARLNSSHIPSGSSGKKYFWVLCILAMKTSLFSLGCGNVFQPLPHLVTLIYLLVLNETTCSQPWLQVSIIQWAFTNYWVVSTWIFEIWSGNSNRQPELKISGWSSVKKAGQTSLVVQQLRLHLSMQGVQVQSLVREPRYHMAHGEKKKKKN